MSITTRSHSWNKEYSDILDELSNVMTKKGDSMKARAYGRARDTIQSIPQDIQQIEQLQSTPTIGASIYDKLEEYTKTGFH